MRNLFLLVFLISFNVNSQTGIPDYLSVPYPSNLIASKNGKTIAWVFYTLGSRNIFIAESPGFNARQLTHFSGDDGMEIDNLTFTPNGETLLFVRGNGANSMGETANPAQLQVPTERILWKVNKDDGQLQQIGKGTDPAPSPDSKQVVYRVGSQIWMASLIDSSKHAQLFMARGFPTQVRWSPDGKKIAFVSNRDDHSLIGIYSMQVKTLEYPDPSMDLQSQPAWSPDGNTLAYLNVPNIHNLLLFTPVRSGNPWSIRTLNILTGEARELWKASPGRGSIFLDNIPVAENLLWWAIDDQLIFPYEKDGWQHLYSINAKTKEVRLLTPGNGEIENVVISEDGTTILFTANFMDINRRHLFKLKVKDGIVDQLSAGKGIEWSPVFTSNGFACLHSSAVKPAWPAVDNNGAINDIATDLFPKNFPTALVEPQAVTITAKDGLRFTADIFLPPNYDPQKKYPAVIFFHGGSRRQMLLGFHYSQYYSNAYALNQYFAAHGYIAIAVNYRSGIGYGLEFREALNYGAAGASEVNDVMAAGKYLRDRKDVNGKIAVWGGSYGGYLTAHALARASDLFACGVDIHGVHNWNDEIPIFTSWYDYAKFPDLARKALESSPIYYVKGWKSPVLLIHGDDDRNVYFSESVNLAEKLRQQQVHVEQLVLPDEIHDILLHKNWVKIYEATFDFIERQIGKK